MNNFKDRIFEKSQKLSDLHQKMKYLFNTMHCINRLDTWWKLYMSFQSARENPWYPVPILENRDKVLTEIVNQEIAEDEL